MGNENSGRYNRARDNARATEAANEKWQDRPPPEDMPEYGRAKWAEFVPFLAARRTLSEADRTILEMACRALARAEGLQRTLDEMGTTYEKFSPSGGVSILPRPEFQQHIAATAAATRLLGKLGLTPADRGMPKVLKGQTVGQLDRFKRKA